LLSIQYEDILKIYEFKLQKKKAVIKAIDDDCKLLLNGNWVLDT